MKSRKYLCIILILSMVTFASCGRIDTFDQLEQADRLINHEPVYGHSDKTNDFDQARQTESIVDLERMDHSIKNEDGELLATVYFDKPILSGDDAIASKINAYFEDEYERWLNGTASRLTFYYDGTMQRLKKHLNDMRTYQGDDSLTEMPLKYTADIKIIYEDQDVLSILQTEYTYFGGPIHPRYFGSTFDLKTGELMPFTYFSDVNADDFRNSLATYLIKSNVNTYYSEEELIDFIGPNSDHSFNFEADYHDWDLSFEYFYDGTSIYLTQNHLATTSYIIEWNGKTGDQFRGTLLWEAPHHDN